MIYRSRIRTKFHGSLEREVCRRDVVHWCNRWCWTYDPREKLSIIPFDLFPRQAAFLCWLAEREARQEDGLVEKSRDAGITWLCCVYALHAWLFRDGAQVGFGSRKLDLVDKIGDPACIFDKLRFLLYNLPEWMRPDGFRSDDHDCYTKLINPANGSTITGEGGDQIGRGGRAGIYFVDEASFLEHPLSVERSLSQTTRCRIDVSTPNGPGNPFYAKRFSGRVPVFTLHWRDDPRKGEAWYAYQRDVKYAADPVGLAQEVDIDYTASVDGICIPAAWVRAAVGLKLPESSEVSAGLDVAEEGGDLSVLVVRRGPVVDLPVSWAKYNTTQTAWKARDEAASRGASVVHFDCVGVGAGVRGTWQSAASELPFEAVPVNVGEAPTETRWPDGKTSKEKFVNLKAELWWKVRARFEKAYEHVSQGVSHPPDEMISLPDHPQLIAELSLPLHERTEAGKIQIEPKRRLKARGVKSPDFAEALVLSFAGGRARKPMVW